MRTSGSTPWSFETASGLFNGFCTLVNPRYTTEHWGWAQFPLSPRFGLNFSSHASECLPKVGSELASTLHRAMFDLGLRQSRILSGLQHLDLDMGSSIPVQNNAPNSVPRWWPRMLSLLHLFVLNCDLKGWLNTLCLNRCFFWGCVFPSLMWGRIISRIS